MALSGSQVTYPSLYGGPGVGYGNFALKIAYVPVGAGGPVFLYEWTWDKWLPAIAFLSIFIS